MLRLRQGQHALKPIAHALRDKVNWHGVGVLSFFTGRTATPMQAAVHESERRPYRSELLILPEDVPQ